MKLKSALVASAMLLVGTLATNAASFAINNLGDTLGDTLFSNSAGTPMSGGIAAIGYFPDGVVISSLGDLMNNLGSYTNLSFAAIGDTSGAIGANYNGYAINLVANDIGTIVGPPLLGRTLYTVFGNGATLAASTLFGAVNVGTIQTDSPFPVSYTGNPAASAGGVVVVGSAGTFSGDVGFGVNSYKTVNLAPAVPEPSAILLGALGALGLLRRRRN